MTIADESSCLYFFFLVAVDIEGDAFRRMVESSVWIDQDDAAFKRIADAVPPQKKVYAAEVRHELRHFLSQRPSCRWLWLYSIRENRQALLPLGM
jgi:translation initiation factor 2-alpha kinase 4